MFFAFILHIINLLTRQLQFVISL